jgi:hypothetical protein
VNEGKIMMQFDYAIPPVFTGIIYFLVILLILLFLIPIIPFDKIKEKKPSEFILSLMANKIIHKMEESGNNIDDSMDAVIHDIKDHDWSIFKPLLNFDWSKFKHLLNERVEKRHDK